MTSFFSGEVLQFLSGDLVDREKLLDNLEEWLVPLLEELESADFNRKEIPELEETLQVSIKTCLIRIKGVAKSHFNSFYILLYETVYILNCNRAQFHRAA